MSVTITFRVLQTIEEMHQVQQLEEKVWGMTPIPTHQTLTAVKNGGLVIGAFNQEMLVGFSYSFPGYKNNEVYLCSHMLGIHPDYQLQGIGENLKMEQLKIAKELGYKLITWTFDPLESRNAYLNHSKLYGVSDIYIENCYGEMELGINKGLPTDRLQIEWWITSDRVENQWLPTDVVFEQPFQISLSENNFPILIEPYLFEPIAEGYEIPIPKEIQEMKTKDQALALKWRLSIRKAMQKLFSATYTLIAVRKADELVNYYQFVKKSTVPLRSKE